jgi:DNA-binding transcriptional regulator PaaX
MVKFFLNSSLKAYLRQLVDEFRESTNSVRIELSRLTEGGFLESYVKGNTIMFRVKKSHQLFLLTNYFD